MQAFDSKKYKEAQVIAIKERLSQFAGRLYLEIGGHLLHDGHASRVLPGFEPTIKVDILEEVGEHPDIIYCLSAELIQNEDSLWDQKDSLKETILKELKDHQTHGFRKPIIAINLYRNQPKADSFIEKLVEENYEIYKRYWIEDYPNDISKIVSEEGYGKDEYIPTQSKLVIVTGIGSNNGKMSTCLGLVYQDRVEQGLDSGYAKYETFPIWQLAPSHPINLAYEAATVNIGDYNLYDPHHKRAYNQKATNYNRDVDAYPILEHLIKEVASPTNPMQKYKSPTDMGINMAYLGIVNMEEAIKASKLEITRRITEYTDLVDAGKGKVDWIEEAEKKLQLANSHVI